MKHPISSSHTGWSGSRLGLFFFLSLQLPYGKPESCGYLYKFELFDLLATPERKEGQKQIIRIAETYKLCGF
ncbi:hypothetical protein SAMN05216403_13616 [Nitrosospira multiformis ATCC 25196]|uniref:Uncharacterized protein n=1 Tax=Nitrosospira multiformis (strain ATCC 25196 / NCIMB 11849 / C 71) TaxID=323848 RepID=A0A1H5XTS3_NITMU|nr:hypothetical protein SAMN05216411_12610 [Nitrosospira multiformis]SEG14837.1 hypothetical protein SAMN05216403_13616 [Nitrosospira multiformis ATCC 25196]